MDLRFGALLSLLIIMAQLVKQLYNKFPTSQVEKLQLSFFKYLLRVNRKASNAAVLGELGRFPLYIDVGCNILNFFKTHW